MEPCALQPGAEYMHVGVHCDHKCECAEWVSALLLTDLRFGKFWGYYTSSYGSKNGDFLELAHFPLLPSNLNNFIYNSLTKLVYVSYLHYHIINVLSSHTFSAIGISYLNMLTRSSDFQSKALHYMLVTDIFFN